MGTAAVTAAAGVEGVALVAGGRRKWEVLGEEVGGVELNVK